MRRATLLSSLIAPALAAGLFALAAPALAQQPPSRQADSGQALGMRYLSWPGKTETASAPTQPGASARPGAGGGLRRNSPVIPHGGFATARPPQAEAAAAPPRRNLTPANAWMSPPAPQPPPLAVSAPAPAPIPISTPQPRADYLPDPGRDPAPVALQPQAQSAAMPYDQPYPQAATTDPTDPMAPRRDALIFSIQRPGQAQPAPQAAPAQPQPQTQARPAETYPVAANTPQGAQAGSRYYSVHRQNGRQPDPTPLPEPLIMDASFVSPGVDLAEPPADPPLARTADGRVRPQVANSDPSLP